MANRCGLLLVQPIDIKAKTEEPRTYDL